MRKRSNTSADDIANPPRQNLVHFNTPTPRNHGGIVTLNASLQNSSLRQRTRASLTVKASANNTEDPWEILYQNHPKSSSNHFEQHVTAAILFFYSYITIHL